MPEGRKAPLHSACSESFNASESVSLLPKSPGMATEQETSAARALLAAIAVDLLGGILLAIAQALRSQLLRLFTVCFVKAPEVLLLCLPRLQATANANATDPNPPERYLHVFIQICTPHLAQKLSKNVPMPFSLANRTKSSPTQTSINPMPTLL